MNTELLYLHDSTIVRCEATVVDVITENEKVTVILDKTIFYPQGGGQPFDQGSIKNDKGIFKVNEVRFIDGIVHHIGQFESGNFASGAIVTLAIDESRRTLHTRLHSAGHIVDMAVATLKLPWIPGKGYHFPQGPYVEYTADCATLDKEKLKADIEHWCNEFTKQDVPTKGLVVAKEELHKYCRHVPETLPANKPIRVMMYGDFGVPCGGTHVSNLRDIGRITIRKLKCEGNTIRVSYEIEK